MRTAVQWEGREVGWLDWRPDAYGVQVEVDCAQSEDALLLRCYGETAAVPLLIGLPAPEGGRLRLRRHISRETLKASGCAQSPPTVFYLSETGARGISDAPEQPTIEEDMRPAILEEPAEEIRTGDTVLDLLLTERAVTVAQESAGVVLRCPFAPKKPFALAPVFALCSVKEGDAVLRWPLQKA